ncbi:MAG: prepilin-type N-terminal cleavage/methylation domain-containing protein [Chitinispirillales bacterium]|jgi:prepilin-type N-terminal cleavage/methylation domain-containing protein|nr:prepilin-type N-terminal cleavage/methylation domain-containing protein [Chitinispirillales bacterium]
MRKAGINGMTLMELMVTISISTIVFTLILSSWNYLNKHVFYQESKGIIQDETARIAQELMLKLRRTPGVLEFTYSSVKLLEHDGGDTLEYAFDGRDLTRNGMPVAFNTSGGRITSFDVNSQSDQTAEHLLLEIAISSSDNRNNSDTNRFVVNVKNGGAFSESDFLW